MISRLKKMFDQFSAGSENEPLQQDELQLATAALLVEAAVMDGHCDDEERAVIERALIDRFSLEKTEAAELLSGAEEAVKDTSQIYGFTRVIKDRTPHEERVEIIEMLWEVAYADGELHDYEANLVRRVAGLINVSDRDSGTARKTAQRALGIG